MSPKGEVVLEILEHLTVPVCVSLGAPVSGLRPLGRSWWLFPQRFDRGGHHHALGRRSSYYAHQYPESFGETCPMGRGVPRMGSPCMYLTQLSVALTSSSLPNQ
jgi:hypothetical protein